MTIRPATAADIAELEALDRSGWPPGSTPAPPGPGPVFGTRIQLNDVLVSVDTDRVCGYVVVGRRTPFPANDHIAVLRSIVVREDVRRTGVAQALVAAAEALARSRRARQLRVFVLGSNGAALALYAKAGFVEVARIPAEYRIADRFVDDVIMSKDLGVP
jgi:ribosomal protein S18 acetylase RimI-like enzyme